MTSEATTIEPREFEYLRVVDEAGRPLLLLDCLHSPSGHYVLTVSAADDTELFQLHTVDAGDGASSPLRGLTLFVADADGSHLFQMTGERITLYGSVERD